MPFVSSRGLHRMLIVAGVAFLHGLFATGIEVIMPLWVTQDLGMTPDKWAQLRSLRMTGVLVGIVFLGALSDRFGQRLLGALTMVVTAALLVLLPFGPRTAIWIVMPIFGAMVSTSFVNLNTLTQLVSQRRQGWANTIYRSIGTAAGIVSPVLATKLVVRWGGFSGVFIMFAAIVLVAGALLMFYPGEPRAAPLGNLMDELKGLWRGYAVALRNRQLVHVINITQFWFALLGGVTTFAAIRFTMELHQSDQGFGTIASIASAVALAAMLITATFLDRVSLPVLHGVLGIAASAASMVMGWTDEVVPSILGYIAFSPLYLVMVGPNSMWISRVAPAEGQTSAFSLHKVCAAFYTAITMWALGQLEPYIGIRNIMFWGGALGLVTAATFFFFSHPRTRAGQAAAAFPITPVTGSGAE